MQRVAKHARFFDLGPIYMCSVSPGCSSRRASPAQVGSRLCTHENCFATARLYGKWASPLCRDPTSSQPGSRPDGSPFPKGLVFFTEKGFSPGSQKCWKWLKKQDFDKNGFFAFFSSMVLMLTHRYSRCV